MIKTLTLEGLCKDGKMEPLEKLPKGDKGEREKERRGLER